MDILALAVGALVALMAVDQEEVVTVDPGVVRATVEATVECQPAVSTTADEPSK